MGYGEGAAEALLGGVDKGGLDGAEVGIGGKFSTSSCGGRLEAGVGDK